MGTHLSDFILTYESEPDLYWFIIVLASQTPDLSCVREKKSDLGHIDLCECSHSF